MKIRKGGVKIKIKNSQTEISINRRRVTELAKKTLKILGVKEAELSVLFTGKQRIRTLNKKFRKIDRPTDVLAFSMREGKSGAVLHPEILGDVVICPEIAQHSAMICQTSKEHELYLCLVHGILHLLGYDDSHPRHRLLMEKEQARILKSILKR